MVDIDYSLLNTQPRKRNVFVTQLQERQDEADDKIDNLDIVHENAGKLLENGTNTMQKTLMLKKHVEMERVDADLRNKTDEFERRQSSSKEKQYNLLKEQERMKNQVSKFEKFIQEYNVRRHRAIQKYQQEVRLKVLKHQEYEGICKEMEMLKQRQEYLKKKLERYKKFEEYLKNAVALLPQNYLEVQDTVLNSLLNRHKTLSATKLDLMENLINMTDEHESKKQELEEIERDQDKMKVSINSELSSLLNAQESSSGVNQRKEYKFAAGKIDYREKRTQYACIMISIDNIAEKCERRGGAPLLGMPIDQKLGIIKNYLTERNEVARRAVTSAQPKTEAE